MCAAAFFARRTGGLAWSHVPEGWEGEGELGHADTAYFKGATSTGAYLAQGTGASPDQLRAVFKRIDVDRSGSLDCHELHEALLALKCPATLEDTELLMRTVNRGHNGTLGFDDFCALYGAAPEPPSPPRSIELRFPLVVLSLCDSARGGTEVVRLAVVGTP